MAGLGSEAKQRKVVVIGLDGVPHGLLNDYMAGGVMPEFSKICREGRLLKMASSLPEVSSVAWSGFMTGKNPGEHGIFGFMEIDRKTYKYLFPNFSSLKVPPFWERRDIRTVACNIPQTYPARPMNGALVSGFVALDLEKATYPRKVFEYLKGIDYRLDVNARLAHTDPQAFFENVMATFEKRTQAIKGLYDNEDWRLFVGVVTETDRLHHFFFDSAREGVYFEVFERFYRELDRFLQEMSARAARDGALFLTCSDHGFTTIKSEVYLNRWLMENGYLRLNSPGSLAGIDAATRAFCLEPSRIYIHLKGEYANGGVGAAEYPRLVDELARGLSAIEFEGRPVIKKLYTKNEIFQGGQAGRAPDIYLLPHEGFDLKGALDRDALFGTTRFRGMHTYDDAHLFLSEGPDPGKVCIEDVAGIILNHLFPGDGA